MFMDMQKVRDFLMQNNENLDKFEQSIIAVLKEGGWKQADANSAIACIKDTLGIKVAVSSGV
jgi:hypothetical protein